MILRLVFFASFLLTQSEIFSQTFVWNNEKKIKGRISFDDMNINFLIVKFDESYVGYDRASQIYKQNYEKYQSKLESILEMSGLNYELISKDQLNDSTFMDTEKYPVMIDHETYMSGVKEADGSYLRLLVRDRRTEIQVSVDLLSQATKYSKPFKKLFRKIKKGKSMRMRMS
jgi:hypothetical protein